MSNYHKKVLYHGRVGPGGWLCICCGPSPKNRKIVKRAAKRSEKQKLKIRLHSSTGQSK